MQVPRKSLTAKVTQKPRNQETKKRRNPRNPLLGELNLELGVLGVGMNHKPNELKEEEASFTITNKKVDDE